MRVGVGDSAARLVSKNPYLKGAIYIPEPGDVVGQMRLSLNAETAVEYDDGDLKLSVCADRISVDGTETLKLGAAFVGIALCNERVENYEAAIEDAERVIQQLRNRNPRIKDLRSFYQSANQSELTAFGGEIWAHLTVKSFTDVPPPREDPEMGLDYLRTPQQARDMFRELRAAKDPKRDPDGRVQAGTAFLGVYGGRYAIFEISVDGAEAFGGDGLTEAQRRAIRYKVTMHFRRRSDL
jgi:hypothetical protein